MAALAQAALDLLFPPRCVACHRFGSCLCEKCQAQIELLQPPLCHRCGRPYPFGGICSDCRRAGSSLDGIRSAAKYDEPLRSSILQFKYHNVRDLAKPLGAVLCRCFDMHTQPLFDLIVPVPLHKRRLRERGYNQADLLARELSLHSGIPMIDDQLVRARHTAPQVSLAATERQRNVQGAFRCPTAALCGRSVLLVDDVCTTGSTLEACATALCDQGQASAVWAMTVARAGVLDDGVRVV